MSPEMTDWVDVSVTVRHDMPHWPDNPPVVLEPVMDLGRSDVCNVSHLAETKVQTVGIDHLSVGGYHADGAKIHKILLQAGIWIIEGLDLSPVTGHRRPYDLRHAAVSTWLNARVDPTLVAAWAGHSVQVLLQVYAKCIVGRDEIARRRIEAALGLDS